MYYVPPAYLPGTVFDPADDTFGPIMAAIQGGEFEIARNLLNRLLKDPADLEFQDEE